MGGRGVNEGWDTPCSRVGGQHLLMSNWEHYGPCWCHCRSRSSSVLLQSSASLWAFSLLMREYYHYSGCGCVLNPPINSQGKISIAGPEYQTHHNNKVHTSTAQLCHDFVAVEHPRFFGGMWLHAPDPVRVGHVNHCDKLLRAESQVPRGEGRRAKLPRSTCHATSTKQWKLPGFCKL